MNEEHGEVGVADGGRDLAKEKSRLQVPYPNPNFNLSVKLATAVR